MAAAIKKRPGLGRQRQSGKMTDRQTITTALVSAADKPASRCQVEQSVSETRVNARRPSPTANRKPSAFATGRATFHTQWTLDDWKSVLFTDESKVIGYDGAL